MYKNVEADKSRPINPMAEKSLNHLNDNILKEKNQKVDLTLNGSLECAFLVSFLLFN